MVVHTADYSELHQRTINFTHVLSQDCSVLNENMLEEQLTGPGDMKALKWRVKSHKAVEVERRLSVKEV